MRPMTIVWSGFCGVCAEPRMVTSTLVDVSAVKCSKCGNELRLTPLGNPTKPQPKDRKKRESAESSTTSDG